VVGAGPAGLACAHGLARQGHRVLVFDANAKPGGLNEYGLASYKTVDGFAQREVDWLLSIGGIELRCDTRLGRDITLEQLTRDHDAVFLGMGLAGVNGIGIPEPESPAVRNAIDFIAELRQASDYARLPIGRRVVVVGGGMTAVDAAVQSRKLGAEEVTIVYRRGEDEMPATPHERAWARTNGVLIRHWATPAAILTEGGQVSGVRFTRTRMTQGTLESTGDTFDLQADLVLKAIGQSMQAQPLGALVELQGGRIRTDAHGATSHPRIWAGGDCRAGDRDLTVEAVEHGKRAALAIHAALAA